MPKLAPEQMDERIALVEEAALALFKERGFHGVGLREIADAAGVSLGNIYNYFESKEALFESVLARLQEDFAASTQPLVQYLLKSRFPDDLEEFGRAVGKMVEEHDDYLTLIYVDIAEFDGAHVRPYYGNLKSRFESVLKSRFDELRAGGGFAGGVDPAVAFTAVYMSFFNYFIVERLIGAKGHMGLSDNAAVKALATLFRNGVGSDGK